MSRNDALDFAQRLYARLPGHYRTRDTERGLALLALLRVIGTQVANLREDMDVLWDNFFIETCDDWVVPYIGTLLGTKLLAHPVGQSERLDVWNTVAWRRSRGTPRMLQALATAISGWPCDFSEFFQRLGWSQNLNHLRLAALLTPDLRDSYALSLLGRANESLLHSADFKPARDLDQARTSAVSLGIGRAGWGTPGRYQIKNLGFFIRRLLTFPVTGVTPASVPPGANPDPNAACFTFDPLHRDVPLFSESSNAPISSADFAHAPWRYFGSDIGVRQYGVLVATSTQPQALFSSSQVPFTFGQSSSGLKLHATQGMRLIESQSGFESGGVGFVVTAEWQQDNGTVVTLGSLNTYEAALGLGTAFQPGSSATGAGRLRITLALLGAGSSPWTVLPFTGLHSARFSGAVLAMRRNQQGSLRTSDGLYLYLPAAHLHPGGKFTLWVADDGSTYYSSSLDVLSEARPSEGQTYPQWNAPPSAGAASGFTALNRGPHGLVIVDRSRFGGTAAIFTAELFTGVPQMLGAIATVDLSGAAYPRLKVPSLWPAFTFGADPNAVRSGGVLDILVQPLGVGSPPNVGSPPLTNRIPATELVFMNRAGASLLIYLPEIVNASPDGVRFLVADDGSTYYFPADSAVRSRLISGESFGSLVLARGSAGQVVPVTELWPLQQRRPAAINLCRCERRSLLRANEFGVDPELGRFAFSSGDPAIGQGALTVDFVEAFGDQIGAVNFDRQTDTSQLAARLVSSSGDADVSLSARSNAPVYTTVAAALAASQDGDIIEIIDSATYAHSAPVVFPAALVNNLTIRAKDGARPCLTFYNGPGSPTPASFLVTAPMQSLELSGILISGGPVVLHSPVQSLALIACTLDPQSKAMYALLADSTSASGSNYLLCRCVAGGLRLGDSVLNVTVADSILDAPGGVAIGGAKLISSPPQGLMPLATNATVQLERVTVLGQVYCNVLQASECLLDSNVFVKDQQAGCIRFSRYEVGSVLPRRYRCVPGEEEVAACSSRLRCLPPLFNSRLYGRPGYAQLASAGPGEIFAASESGSEVGAFASRLNTIRSSNLTVKLQEFMPVGLTPVIIAET
jgi:hypothetical protein